MVNIKRDINKIYMVAGLGCLLLTVSMYFFGLKPLFDRLRTEHSHEISHFLVSGRAQLQAVLDRHIGLARQSASRTAIRTKQIAYLNGKVSRKDFIAFSAPKLADAMNANKDIVGIQRYDPGGKLLFSVGLVVPGDVVADCVMEKLPEVRMLGLVLVGGTSRLIYCSPIVDRDAGYVGADILVMNDTAIREIVNTPQDGLGYYSIVSKGRIVYWPSELQDKTARAVLEACLSNGCKEHSYDSQGYSGESYIFDSRPLKDIDWQLYSVVSKAEFFSDINRQWLILLIVIALVTIFVFALTVLVMRPMIRALLREKQLVELTHHDGLTGMYNHAYMQELLDLEFERARRHGRLFSVLMFDLDHFKKVNDVYGHQAGDEVLQRIAGVVSQTIRKIDLAARYGGEEFLIMLPETGSEGAMQLAERLRSNVSQVKVSSAVGEISITISVGVVTCDACYDHYNKQQVVNEADRALYASKGAGRNQVTAVTLKGAERISSS